MSPGSAAGGSASTLDIRPGEGFCLLRVKVTPKASRNQVLGVGEGALRLRIQAPPADGAANEKAGDFLAELLDRPRGTVRLEHGHANRLKVFRLEGMEPDSVRARLAAAFPG